MRKMIKRIACGFLLVLPLTSYAFDLLPYASEAQRMKDSRSQWFASGVLKVYENKDRSSAIEGFDLISKSAKLGMPHALGAMGLFYEQGLFVNKDTNLAKKYYEDAVSLESPIGYFGMARIYENGYGGIEPNISDRNFWLRKGADANNKESLFGLAVAFEKGEGLQVNHRTAAKHYLKACDQKMLEACFNLGIKLAKGMDLPQSYADALALLLYAQDNGFTPASKAIEGFIRFVPEAELNKAILNAAKMTKLKAVAPIGLSF